MNNREREANTLEMLYASRLSAGQIVVGKALSVISYPLLLITTGLPLASMLSFRGAVNFQQLLWAYLLLLVAAALLRGAATASAKRTFEAFGHPVREFIEVLRPYPAIQREEVAAAEELSIGAVYDRRHTRNGRYRRRS